MDETYPDYNPSAAVPDGGANDVVPAGGSENESAVGLRELVKQATGREYSTDEAALKGISETFKMVGKRVEPQVVEKTVVDPEILSKVNSLEKALQETTFYAQNPEYNTEDFKSLVKLTGKSPSELVSSDDFKTLYEKAKAYNEIEQSKSVLHSNSRLGQVTDKFTQAKEALKTGNDAVAKSTAVSAVIDAFDLR